MTALVRPRLEAAALLENLLRIPSPTGSTADAATMLCRIAVEAGLHAGIDPAGNVVIRAGAEHAGPDVLLLGHLDTVPGDLPVHVSDGRIFGRGAVDAKGPLAAALSAVSRLAPVGAAVTLVAAADEEGASLGARLLRDTWPSPRHLIVLEPSGWDAVTVAYRGCLRLEAAVEQPTTHHAVPGAGAADVLVATLAALQRELEPAPGGDESATNRAVDRVQVRINALRSEEHVDVERAHAAVEIRIPLGSAVDEVLKRATTALQGADVTVQSACEPVRVPRSGAAVRALSRAIGRAGVRPRHLTKTGTSDLNVVWPRWRCDAAVYGPGDSALDHTVDESIDISELCRGSDILLAALEALR